MPSALSLRSLIAPAAAGLALVLIAAAVALLPGSSALLLIGGAALALALVRYPALAVYLLVFAVPFGSLFPVPIAGANVTAADGLLLLGLALWLARQISRREILVRPTSLVLPFLVFILAAGASVTAALSLQASAKELYKWIELFAIYWLLVQDFSVKQLAVLLVVVFAAGLAEGAVGLAQSFFGVGPEGFLLFGGANLRVFGTFEQPNPFAGYLGLIIPLAFGTALGLLAGPAGRAGARWMRLALAGLAVAALAVMLAALYLSFSRGAWLASAAALAVTFLIRSKRAAVLGLLAGLAITAVLLLGQLNIVPDIIGQRFQGVADYIGFQDVRGVKVTDENFALVERLAHWEAALAMFEQHPWLGVGWGNYAVVYPGYALPHWDDPLGHAHNYYLNVLAESGVVGLGGFAVLWGAIFWNAWRAVRAARGALVGVAAGAFGVLVAVSVHNLFDNLFVHSMQLQVGVTLGMLELIRRER